MKQSETLNRLALNPNEYASDLEILAAAESFVAALGVQNRAHLARNLRYVTRSSDAIKALHLALARTEP